MPRRVRLASPTSPRLPSRHRGVGLILAVAEVLWTVTASAEPLPQLPPPPPPPIGDEPAPAPAPLPPRAQESPAPPPGQPSRPVVVQPSGPPPPPPYRYRRRRREVYVAEEEPDARLPVALTFDPLALTLGRLSGNLEVLLAPHHALILSPNVLVYSVERDPGSIESAAMGYASSQSQSFGAELGYHYWWRSAHSLTGPFFGPSFLIGRTDQSTATSTTSAQTYTGFALDAGGQHVFPGGFTFGAGLGLGLTHMSSTTVVFPRFLLQLGWSV